jgi:zinc transporter 1
LFISTKKKHSFSIFSWVRAQELGAMVNCILLMSLCFTILVQAVKRLITIEPVDRTKLKLYIIVGVIGLAINVMALLILGGSRFFYVN